MTNVLRKSWFLQDDGLAGHDGLEFRHALVAVAGELLGKTIVYLLKLHHAVRPFDLLEVVVVQNTVHD